MSGRKRKKNFTTASHRRRPKTPYRLVCLDPGFLRPKSQTAEHCTGHLEATRFPHKRGHRTTHCSASADGCSTDPDPNMDMQQAHVRNMRSKCRCSCVLQFTLRHGVSSVLHRPPSQMIHCIVLYLGFRRKGQSGYSYVPFSTDVPYTGGAQNPSREARLFKAE